MECDRKPVMSAIIDENMIVRKNCHSEGKLKSVRLGISKSHHKNGSNRHGVVTSKLKSEYLIERHLSRCHSTGSDSQGQGSAEARYRSKN